MSSNSLIESPLYHNLANRIGSFIEYWGFKQVHGKIWTLIFLSPEPIDANYLKNTLKISKALTSMTLKDLLHYDVIREVAKEKPGTQKYQINPNITEVIMNILRQRELKLLEEVQKDCQKLQEKVGQSENGVVAPNRMAELTEMVDVAHGLLQGMLGFQTVDFKAFDQVMSIKD